MYIFEWQRNNLLILGVLFSFSAGGVYIYIIFSRHQNGLISLSPIQISQHLIEHLAASIRLDCTNGATFCV